MKFATFVLCVCITLIDCLTIRSASSVSGILSRGNDWPVDGRTSLVIPADGWFYMDDKLDVEFDLRVCRNGDHFGYVCTVQVGDEEMSLMVLNSTDKPTSICAVSPDGTSVILKHDGEALPIYEFNHINLSFEREGDIIAVSESGERLFTLRSLAGKLPVKITFGKGIINGRSRVDVAPMEIKDITISLGQDRTTYFFPLAKSKNDSLVMDAGGVVSGRISNFDWLKDAHSKWKLMRTLPFDNKVYPVSMPGSRYLYLISGNRVARVDLERNRVIDTRINPAIDISRISDQFIVVKGEGNSERIMFYNSENVEGYPVLSALDLGNGKWDVLPMVKKPMSRSNHTAFYRDSDSSIVEMLGYGYHRYYSDGNLIKPGGVIEPVLRDSSGITPRYLSAMGYVDPTTIMLYGGIGNLYGGQEFGSQLFTDLYTIDVNTLKITKVLDNVNGGREIAARSLITDADSCEVLGLFYDPYKTNSYLTLKSLNLANGETVALTDSIPYNFHDMTSSADLLHPRSSESLFAVTVHRVSDNDYTVNVYSLRLPVLVFDDDSDLVRADGRRWFLPIVIFIAVIIALVIIIWYRKYRAKRQNDALTPEDIIEPSEPTGPITAPIQTTTKEKPEILAPGIYILGGFKVIDNSSLPITEHFTPLLRSLLSLLVVYTKKNETGISNASLKDALWMDKSDESFLNNRSVNIRKLRTLLGRIEDVSLEGSHGHWVIKVAEGSRPVDYFVAMDVMKNLKRKNYRPAAEDIDTLVEIAGRGELLPEMQSEWLDQFKAEYADSMIETLRRVFVVTKEMGDVDVSLKLTSAILKFDSIDEDAVRAKCGLLMDSHRMGSAIKTFNHFAAEYKVLMGQDFSLSFNEFMSTRGS